MTKIIGFIPWLALLLTYLSCQPAAITEQAVSVEKATTLSAVVDTSCPIGYVALDMETVHGLFVEPELYEILDAMSKSVKKLLPLQSSYTEREAIAILATIHKVMEQYKQSSVSVNNSFSISLRYKTFDAYARSLLYLTIADVCKLPIYAILTPNHMIIKWNAANHKIYWETTTGQVIPKHYYDSTYKLPEYQGVKDKFLGKLSRKQLFNLIFFKLGKTYAVNHQYNKAISLLEQVTTQKIDWFQPYTVVGQLYRRMGLSQKAITYYQKSLDLQPKQPYLYKEMGIAYATLGCNTESIKAYQRYLKLLSTKSQQYYTVKKDVQARINALN